MRFLKSFVNSFGDVRGTEADIEIALHQALANAVVHGNREDILKRVWVTSRCSMDGEVSIAVRDEGQGFHGYELQGRTDPNEGLLAHRWGLYLTGIYGRRLLRAKWQDRAYAKAAAKVVAHVMPQQQS